jgi:serine/threonine protein kinase
VTAPAVNAAVKANLEKVLATEQRASALRMAWVRFVVATLACAAIWGLPVQPGAESTIGPTRWGVVAFVVLSGALLFMTRKYQRVGKWASLSVPLLDVPLLSLIQHAQIGMLPQPWMGVPTNVGMMLGLIVLSGLSLSRAVIWATALAAEASIVATLVRVDLAGIPLVLTALVPLAVGAILAAVVNRIRTLLHEARAKDLVGKYVLGDRLGVGGMAEVFLATYSPEGGFERKVAVKRILPSYSENTESVALFRREAELGAMLAHPNIVQVLDFGTDGSTYFLAMEYVEGLPLSRLLLWCRQTGTVLPLPAVVTIAWMVSEATDYIHSRTSPTGTTLKLVHRDLNPPNIMISRIGEVKLGDFGIARASTTEQITAAGILRGKVGYSAPEQLLDQPYDSRADLFSLGVTLHETLTSKRLFTGESDVAVYKACLEGTIPRPSELRADVPPVLDAIVMGLLERRLEARTQSAHEVVTKLATLPPELADLKLGQQQLTEVVSRARAELTDPQRATPGPPGSAQATKTVTVSVTPSKPLP